jgi:hypothetical protein
MEPQKCAHTLAPREIADLRRDRGIYIVDDGRINVAGLPSRRDGGLGAGGHGTPGQTSLNDSGYPLLE